MDKELIILEQIQNNPQINQRDLASVAQASLGMTNAILKRFVNKGLITIKKVNNRNIRYALTAQGAEEISQRSWKYFKRTIRNVVIFQDAISEIIQQAIVDEYKEIILYGESDFLFIIEHLCYKKNIPFKSTERITDVDQAFILISENYDSILKYIDKEICFYLNKLIINN